MSQDLDKVSAPRLAHLAKGETGYGFNLHGDKNQPGQTISAVDKDSPADLGGLIEGDKVIEVNGENVESKTHGEVVSLIKKKPNETTLLVCDKATLAYLKANNRPCTADMANLSSVIPTEVEAPPQVMANGNATTEVVHEKIEESAPVAVEESTPTPPDPVTKYEDPTPTNDTTPEEVKQLNSVLDDQEKTTEHQPEPVPEPRQPEPPAYVEETREPPKPKEPEKADLKEAMSKARPSRNARNMAKSTGDDWKAKVGAINNM